MLKTKISIFALIFAVMFSAGSSCIFPLFTAQASSEATQMNASNDHETDSVTYIPASQNHVSACLSDCGQANDDAIAVKKTQETLGFSALVLSDIPASPLSKDGSDLNVFDGQQVSSPPDILLTVSKKE